MLVRGANARTSYSKNLAELVAAEQQVFVKYRHAKLMTSHALTLATVIFLRAGLT